MSEYLSRYPPLLAVTARDFRRDPENGCRDPFRDSEPVLSDLSFRDVRFTFRKARTFRERRC